MSRRWTWMLLMVLPSLVQAQWKYETNNNAITITGYTGTDSLVTIPSRINGLPVTSIEYQVFSDCSSLTSITIPNSVISIGAGAFSGCTSLSSVAIPNSVTCIGWGAFYECKNLTSVSIGKGVTKIEPVAFEYCSSLTGVYFQGNAPHLGSNVFDGDENATVYYLHGTTGWESTWGGLPTSIWKPKEKK